MTVESERGGMVARTGCEEPTEAAEAECWRDGSDAGADETILGDWEANPAAMETGRGAPARRWVLGERWIGREDSEAEMAETLEFGNKARWDGPGEVDDDDSGNVASDVAVDEDADRLASRLSIRGGGRGRCWVRGDGIECSGDLASLADGGRAGEAAVVDDVFARVEMVERADNGPAE